jgi:hypothetical protein
MGGTESLQGKPYIIRSRQSHLEVSKQVTSGGAFIYCCCRIFRPLTCIIIIAILVCFATIVREKSSHVVLGQWGGSDWIHVSLVSEHTKQPPCPALPSLLPCAAHCSSAATADCHTYIHTHTQRDYVTVLMLDTGCVMSMSI